MDDQLLGHSVALNRNVGTAMRGDCIIRRCFDEDSTDTWLEVVHADAEVLVADELLRSLEVGQLTRGQREVWLQQPPGDDPWNGAVPWVQWHDHDVDTNPWPCSPTIGAPCYVNALLHVDGRNRTVIYRIGQYHAELNAWRATWPD